MTRRLLHRVRTLVLTALMLTGVAGCESEGGRTRNPSEQGQVYVRLRIAFGHDKQGTRADEHHGTLNEYQVHSGYIMLWRGPEGAAEDDLRLHSTYNLSSSTAIISEHTDLTQLFLADPSEHITSSGYVTLQIVDDVETDDLYALILLNWEGAIDESKITGATTYGQFKKEKISKLGDLTGGYFMTNVAMSKIPGGSQDPSDTDYRDGKGETVVPGVITLPQVKKIFTSDMAKIEDGKTVFVERVASKVTVDYSRSDEEDTGIVIDGNPANTAKIHTLDWTIDNYNTTSYVMRHFNTEWLGLSSGSATNRYPMADPVEVLANYGDKQDSYRTLWGEDVNYDSNTGLVSTDDGAEAFPSTVDAGRPYHAVYSNHQTVLMHENTQRNNQRENATRIVIRIQLKDASKVMIESPYYGVNYEGKGYLFTSLPKLAAWRAGHPEVTDADVMTYENAGGYPYVYYETFIQHLGSDCVSGGSDDGLGKYGIVRNNSYTVNVGTLSELGTPGFPPLGSGDIE